VSPSAPRRRADLVVGDLNDGAETALLDLESRQVTSLNATAAAIWYLCDGVRDLSAISSEVSGAFPQIDRALIEADVARTIAMLEERGLLAQAR
jgi:hypothetical protein